jgi:hypothetical protein
MTAWETWAAGVLNGVRAPIDTITVDALWAWSNCESGTDVMRWLNPLNTTQPWAGARDMNSVGVKAYLTVNDGINATVATLTNGYYPTILSHLRNSVPRAKWGDACIDLGKWGTGCAWITLDYGPAPTALTGDEMTPAQDAALTDTHNKVNECWATITNGGKVYAAAGNPHWLVDRFAALEALVTKPEPPEVEPTPAPAIDSQVAADLHTIAGFLRKFGQ